jgi:hypothetical protein
VASTNPPEAAWGTELSGRALGGYASAIAGGSAVGLVVTYVAGAIYAYVADVKVDLVALSAHGAALGGFAVMVFVLMRLLGIT